MSATLREVEAYLIHTAWSYNNYSHTAYSQTPNKLVTLHRALATLQSHCMVSGHVNHTARAYSNSTFTLCMGL